MDGCGNWRLLCVQMWILWKFVVTTLPNEASSVKINYEMVLGCSRWFTEIKINAPGNGSGADSSITSSFSNNHVLSRVGRYHIGIRCFQMSRKALAKSCDGNSVH